MKKLFLLPFTFFLFAFSTPQDIVTENGYKVLEDSDPERSTIVCTLEPYTGAEARAEEFACQNLFDQNDYVVIDEDAEFYEGVKFGDIVLLTFNGDFVEKIVKNTLNIENRVIGQEIKYAKNYLFKITHVNGNDVYGTSSGKHGNVYLHQDQLPFELNKGDKVIVTFGEYGDDIVKVKKLNSIN